MKYKSALVTETSGSIGGITGSHNRGGQYFRRRVVPTNPNSTYQQTIRTLMSTCQSRWKGLTDAQRNAWAAYAAGTPLKDKLGATVYLTGLQHYIRSNVFAYQTQNLFFDDGPVSMGQPQVHPVSIAATAPSTIALTFDNTDPWASKAGARMVLFSARPASPTKVFFKGPYRKADGVQGNAVPPTSPKNLTAAFAFATSQRVFARVVVQDEEGRLSEPQFCYDDAA